MKKKEDERERKKKASNLQALWVFVCRGRRANGSMVENSNVSVSVGSPAIFAESIAHHNIQSCLFLELMKFVSCAVTFLKLHQGVLCVGNFRWHRKGNRFTELNHHDIYKASVNCTQYLYQTTRGVTKSTIQSDFPFLTSHIFTYHWFYAPI